MDVLVLDDSVACLRMHTANTTIYPPDLHDFLFPIYLARFAQNPLREVAALWNQTTDPLHSAIFDLELDEDQALISPPLLLREFEKVLCIEVASAGISLHDTAMYLDGFGVDQDWKLILSATSIRSWTWCSQGPRASTCVGSPS